MAKNFSYNNYSLTTNSFNASPSTYATRTDLKIQNLTHFSAVIRWYSDINGDAKSDICVEIFDNYLFEVFKSSHTTLFYNSFEHKEPWDPWHHYTDLTVIYLNILLFPIITFSQLSFASADFTDIKSSDNILLAKTHYNTTDITYFDKRQHVISLSPTQGLPLEVATDGNDQLIGFNGLNQLYFTHYAAIAGDNSFYLGSPCITTSLLDMLLFPAVTFSQLSFGAASKLNFYYQPILNDDLIMSNSYLELNSSECF